MRAASYYLILLNQKNQKKICSVITPKRVSSGGARLRGVVGCLGNTVTKKRCSGGEPLVSVSNLTAPGIEIKSSSALAVFLTTLTGRFLLFFFDFNFIFEPVML